MNKFFKILLTIIVSVTMLLILDFSIYCIDYQAASKLAKEKQCQIQKFKYNFCLNEVNLMRYLDYSEKGPYRKPKNTTSKLKPIYIFGCSYAYGHYLESEETFDAQLAKLTGRPVYNFALPGFGIQQMLFQLEHLKFLQNQEPEYIVYVYMFDHIRRLNCKWFDPKDDYVYITYKEKNKKLIMYKPFSAFYIYRKIQSHYVKYNSYNNNTKEKNFNNFISYISKIQTIAKKKFPKSKFIFLVYENNSFYPWNNLEKQGIKVLYVNQCPNIDIENEKFLRKDGHPSAAAWQILTPWFIKEAEM